MGKINYNISEISDVENRSITRSNHINNFTINDDEVIVPGNDLNIYEIMDDIKKIYGTILFTVDKYIERPTGKFTLRLNNTDYTCVYAGMMLDKDNIYAALYDGDNTFNLYKLDSDDTPALSNTLLLLDRVNNINSRLIDIERLKITKGY